MAAFGTIPGGVYTLLEKYVLRSNTAVMGARCVKVSQDVSTKRTDLIVYGYSFYCPPK